MSPRVFCVSRNHEWPGRPADVVLLPEMVERSLRAVPKKSRINNRTTGLFMKRTHLSAAIAMACYLSTGVALAQTAGNDQAQATNAQQRASVSTTSNTTNDTATKRAVQQLSAVQVRAQSLELGGGLMSVQEAP